jgi:hypothetical protein
MKLEEIRSKKVAQMQKRLDEAWLNFDLSWWIKWASSLVLLTAMILRGGQAYPFVDLVLSTIGCAGWLAVGIMWKDRALIILNAAAVVILASGVVRVIAGV